MIDYVLLRLYDRFGSFHECVFDRGTWDLTKKISDALDEYQVPYAILYAIMVDGTEEIICTCVR